MELPQLFVEKMKSLLGEEYSDYEACLKRGILLRDCSNFTGLACGYYRVCVSGQKENQNLVHTLEQILEETGK